MGGWGQLDNSCVQAPVHVGGIYVFFGITQQPMEAGAGMRRPLKSHRCLTVAGEWDEGGALQVPLRLRSGLRAKNRCPH